MLHIKTKPFHYIVLFYNGIIKILTFVFFSLILNLHITVLSKERNYNWINVKNKIQYYILLILVYIINHIKFHTQLSRTPTIMINNVNPNLLIKLLFGSPVVFVLLVPLVPLTVIVLVGSVGVGGVVVVVVVPIGVVPVVVVLSAYPSIVGSV